MAAEERVPVLIGAGEVTERLADPALVREPAALMAEALRRAAEDAGAPDLLARLDSLDIVSSVSWPYPDLPGAVAARLPRAPARLVLGPIGGETPVRFIDEAAARIARGESAVAAVVGAEAQHAVAAARKAGIALPWTPPRPDGFGPRRRDYLSPLAVRIGVADPVSGYPFYENATAAAWGLTPAAAHAECAALWAEFSAVAAAHPHAWLRRAHSAAEIAAPGPGNRPIAYPYTKLMVANPLVNQGAAVLLTSLAVARAAGIPEARCVFPWGGAAALEPRDYLLRDTYTHSPSQEAVLEQAMRLAKGAAFDAMELYSCFPVVPRMAARTLGLPPGAVPTVTGGLTFFGAPLNNTMTHAAAALLRALRDGGRQLGLLYGQGEFVTKHHAIVLGRRPPERADFARNVQAAADAKRGPVPATATEASGAAKLETHTVLHDRDGAPTFGAAILRLPDGRRTLARVPAADVATIALLRRPDRTPIGTLGQVRMADVPEWTAA